MDELRTPFDVIIRRWHESYFVHRVDADAGFCPWIQKNPGFADLDHCASMGIVAERARKASRETRFISSNAVSRIGKCV